VTNSDSQYVNQEKNMTDPNRSKRFNPNTFTRKIVPVLLGVLVLILLAVIIIIGLSLTGVIPPA